MLRKRSPSRRSAALCAEQYAVACGFSLAAREQPANMIWLDLLEIENGNFRA